MHNSMGQHETNSTMRARQCQEIEEKLLSLKEHFEQECELLTNQKDLTNLAWHFFYFLSLLYEFFLLMYLLACFFSIICKMMLFVKPCKN